MRGTTALFSTNNFFQRVIQFLSDHQQQRGMLKTCDEIAAAADDDDDDDVFANGVIFESCR